MAKESFTRVSRGYMEGCDWIGFGYFIEKDTSWDVVSYYVFNIEDCRFFYVPFKSHPDADTSEAPVVKKFDYLAEAKDYCRNHRRDI